LLEQDATVRPCVTTTTRPKRPGEVDGRDYHFVTEPVFAQKLKQMAFVEHASVHGHRYGATREAVEAAAGDRCVMLLDVDVQGAENWRRVLGEQCVTVFLRPPSWEVLMRRLKGRRTESERALQIRLENARGELDRAGAYDYLVVNDSLEHAVSMLEAIITAEKHRPARMPEVPEGLGSG